MGSPKRSFRFSIPSYRKPERTFWPTRYSHGLKKKLWIKCNQLTLEALFTSQETSWVWVSSHTGRDCLADLAENSRDLQSVSGFKRCSGCFIRFPNSRVTLSVFTLPPSLLLHRGSFEEGIRDPTRPLIIIHNGTVVYPETLCTFLELGPVCWIT